MKNQIRSEHNLLAFNITKLFLGPPALLDLNHAKVAQLIADHDAAKPCPNVVSCDEGTQYCALAESSVMQFKSRAEAAESLVGSQASAIAYLLGQFSAEHLDSVSGTDIGTRLRKILALTPAGMPSELDRLQKELVHVNFVKDSALLAVRQQLAAANAEIKDVKAFADEEEARVIAFRNEADALRAQVASLVKAPTLLAESIREKLKKASAGQPETWGFVAMFMDMISEAEKKAGIQPVAAPSSEMDFVAALKIAEGVMEKYRVEQPKWWKRMDGTPILNDVAVLMAEAFAAKQGVKSPTNPTEVSSKLVDGERSAS